MRGQRRQAGIKKLRRVFRAWRRDQKDIASGIYDTESWLGQRMLNARTMCSGSCCGNPRRWDGKKARDERRADEALTEELAAWDQLSDEAWELAEL
jgi:hypothetical protein